MGCWMSSLNMLISSSLYALKIINEDVVQLHGMSHYILAQVRVTW